MKAELPWSYFGAVKDALLIIVRGVVDAEILAPTGYQIQSG